MALIVETGIGNPLANSYASVLSADEYFALRNIAAWAALDTPAKEAALISATDYMEATYYDAWKGTKKTQAQALAWPRYNVMIDDFYVADNEVPIKVVQGTIEMALKASSGEPLIADQTQRVAKEKVDVLEITYNENYSAETKYSFVNRMIGSLLRSSVNSGGIQQVRLVRT